MPFTTGRNNAHLIILFTTRWTVMAEIAAKTANADLQTLLSLESETRIWGCKIYTATYTTQGKNIFNKELNSEKIFTSRHAQFFVI
jgi:hypothetical protein